MRPLPEHPHTSSHCLAARCRLEFVVAIGCVLMSVVVYIPSVLTNNSTWIRYTFSLRLIRVFGRMLRMGRLLQFPSMLRFLYVFVSVEHIKVFYLTFLSMLPPASRLFKVRRCLAPCHCRITSLLGFAGDAADGGACFEARCCLSLPCAACKLLALK